MTDTENQENSFVRRENIASSDIPGFPNIGKTATREAWRELSVKESARQQKQHPSGSCRMKR